MSEDAIKIDEAMKLPIQIPVATNSENAPSVKVELPKTTKPLKVEKMNNPTIAILIKPDVTKKVIRASKISENGVVLTLNGDSTVKIAGIEFDDIESGWSEDGIDYVYSRLISEYAARENLLLSLEYNDLTDAQAEGLLTSDRKRQTA